MNRTIVNLNHEEIEEIENKLDEYDEEYIRYRIDGNIAIGMRDGDEIIAGLSACMTCFHILYVSTVFVSEKYRRQGLGRQLLLELEKRAKDIGANMIRLDTFDWQGRSFYEAMGYEQVGSYSNEEDGFSEHFFLKRI